MAKTHKVKVKATKSDTVVEEGLRKVVRSIWPEYTYYPDGLFKFKKFTDGVTNILYRVTMGDHHILVRVYGVGTSKMIDRGREICVQIQLAKQGLAAEFYGSFSNGCSYEYLHGIPMTPDNMGVHAALIAAELAQWHQATVKLGENVPEASSLRLMHEWLSILPAKVWQGCNYSLSDLKKEVETLEPRLAPSPLRFCHNDVLAFNILLNENRAQFIDYEYADYNTRGFDLGNHFNEYAGFDLDVSRYPNRKQQMVFINAYLDTWYGSNTRPMAEEPEQLYREANQWSLVSHLLWGIWGLMQSVNSSIDFDFMAYSNTRLGLYFGNRDTILNLDPSVSGAEYRYVRSN